MIDFKLAHGMDFLPRAWFGEESFGQELSEEALSYIKEKLGERAVPVLTTGKCLQGYQDFSVKPYYRFIFPEDRRKDVAWADYPDICRRSVEWLLYRVRKERPAKELVDETFVFISQSVGKLRSLSRIRYLADITECFDLKLFDLLKPRLHAKCVNYEFASSIMLASIILEPDIFAGLRVLFDKKFARLKLTYRKYSNSTKRYMRQGASREATDLVNLAVEFGFLKSSDDFFKTQGYEWPLEYKGLPYLTGEACVSYDLIRQLANQNPVDFGTLERATKNARTIYLSSYWEKEMSIFMRRAGFAAGKVMSELVSLLMNDAFLSQAEAETLIRGQKHYFRDARGSYVLMLPGQQAFFVALLRLGFRPYKLSREESHRVYGRAELNTGYGLEGTSSIIRYITGSGKTYQNLIVRALERKAPVLHILFKMHLNKRITPDSLRECIRMLSKKDVPIARELERVICA